MLCRRGPSTVQGRGPTSDAAGQIDGESSPWPTPFPLELAQAIANIS